MKKISISNFKGIKLLQELSLYKKLEDQYEKEVNLLLYAENGGGKTSISEAIRLASYADIIENDIIEANIVGEERESAKKDWLIEYLHDKSSNSFETEIDGTIFSSVNTNIIQNANICILDRSQLIPTSSIDIRSIIKKTHFRQSNSYEEFLSPIAIDLVLDEVNSMLKNEFKESISVANVEASRYFVGINGIQDEMIIENIDKKLNEASQNLIKILIFVNYLKLLPPLQNNAKYLIVLDDVMSSLDLANRIILARVIVNLGKDYQLLVMTHNVGLFNLVKNISANNNVSDNWNFTSLYIYNGIHTTYSMSDEDSVDELLKKYGGIILPSNGDAVNAMRKKFESLLHEFGKILVIGVQEETSYLIDKISNIKDDFYCCVEGEKICTHFDLLREISSLAKNCPSQLLKSRIINIYKKYDSNNHFPWIAEVIQNLRTYQKVILHQGSHDQVGELPIISSKEITITLDLMKKLEQITKRSSTDYPYFM